MMIGTRLAGFALTLSAFGAIVVVEVAPPAASPTEAGHPARVVKTQAVKPPAPRPPDHTEAWVKDILARPLFNQGRRPAPAGTGPQSAASGTGLPRLTAILISPDARSAIFAGAAGGKSLVVSEGGSVAGLMVAAIDWQGVAVEGPAGRQTLRPRLDGDRRIDPVVAVASAPPAPTDPAPADPDLPGLDEPPHGRPIAGLPSGEFPGQGMETQVSASEQVAN